jgi:3-hydroxyisobutyrate dehydrogenase
MTETTSTASKPRVAFLGLGDIGSLMARRVAAAGYELAVWNRTPARTERFVAGLADPSRVRSVATAAEAVRGADVIVSCVSTSADVAAILASAGGGGVTGALTRGAVWVDCTSGDPPTCRVIEAQLAAVGVAFLDAPVSGGTSGAEQGTLTVMCGGDADVLERVRPVLATFGAKIVHCGPVGAGDAVKAVNNALLAASLLAAGEGLAALRKAGVAPEVALDVINASSGRSNATMNLIPQRVVTRAFPRTFRLALLDKDVAIAAEFVRSQKVPSPVLQLTAEMMRLAHASLGEAADHVEAIKLIEQWSGVEIA